MFCLVTTHFRIWSSELIKGNCLGFFWINSIQKSSLFMNFIQTLLFHRLSRYSKSFAKSSSANDDHLMGLNRFASIFVHDGFMICTF